MLLALVGITGIGKSYFKNKIADNLDFKKVCTIRTREKRIGEASSSDNLFVTNKGLERLKSEGKIAYSFSVFGGTYAYLKEDIFSTDSMIFEMHYTTISDWKKIRPDIKTIYLMPQNLEIAKDKTRQRNLSKEKEIERIEDIDEHYNKVISDESFRNMFDYIVYNNYDEESEKNVLELVKKLVEGESNGK